MEFLYVLQKTNDDFVVVSFGEKEEEIVPFPNVRSVHEGSTVKSGDFYKFEFPVPEKYSKL
jgi:ribosomal protein S1